MSHTKYPAEGTMIIQAMTVEQFLEYQKMAIKEAITELKRNNIITFNDPFNEFSETMTRSDIRKVFNISIGTIKNWEKQNVLKPIKGFHNPVRYRTGEVRQIWERKALT